MKPRTIAQWEMDKQVRETDRSKRLRDAYIPEHLRSLTWRDYDDNAHTARYSVKEVLQYWVSEWTPEVRDGLVLLGAPGMGKTLGAVLAGMDIIDKGGWVKYTTEDQWGERKKRLIGLEQEAQRSDDWQEANAAAYRLAFIETECDLLVLDDVGKAFRSATDWANTRLDSLLRRRVEAGKATIITSNVKLEGWKDFDASLASFLLQVGELLPITSGKDMRQQLSPTQKKRLGRVV